jgi:hypothetical protein
LTGRVKVGNSLFPKNNFANSDLFFKRPGWIPRRTQVERIPIEAFPGAAAKKGADFPADLSP